MNAAMRPLVRPFATIVFAVILSSLLLSSAHAQTFPCTTSTLILSAQDGNFSNPSTWVGGAVPSDGNCVVIRHNVVLDRDLGTEGGTGVGWVRIENDGSLSADCQAPHSVYFGSTGSDPTGSGNSQNPGADATMFGFFASFGTLNLSCSQPNNVTITSADESDPWYIHHGAGDQVGCTQITNNVCNGEHQTNGAVLNLQNAAARHMGTAVSAFDGIDWDMTSNLMPANSVTIANNHLTDLYEIVAGGSSPQVGNFRVATNWFDSPRPSPSQALVYVFGTPSDWQVNDNTVTNAQTSSFLVLAPDGAAQMQVMRNAVLGSSNIPFSLAAIVAGSGNEIELNLCVNPEPPGATLNSCIAIAGSAGDNRTLISFNVIQGGHAGIAQIGEEPTFAPTFSFNWISQWKEDYNAQGAIITRSGIVTETYNVLVQENSDPTGYMIGNLAYSDGSGACSATVQQDHNTLYGIGNSNGGPNTNFLWGDGGTSPYTCVVNSYARSNISYGGNYSYVNPNDYNTWNLSSGIAYGGAAVHHNLDYGALTAAYVNTQTTPGFDNGTVPHPSFTQYGDLSEDPRFLNPARRPEQWDGICGGPGTNDSLFQNLARRSGFGGIVNPCYSIPALWSWMRLGFAPLNYMLIGTGHDGTYVGAVAPVGRQP